MIWKRNPWWRDIWEYFRHPIQWGGDLPCPFMYIGPWLVTWSRTSSGPWWRTIDVSFMSD